MTSKHAELAAGWPRARLPLVYLDQSVWSSLSRGTYPPKSTRRFTELAHEARFLLVVSPWHIVETVKQKGQVLLPHEAKLKFEHASFMESFPNRIDLRSTQDLLIQEVARAYAGHLERKLASDPPPFVLARPLQSIVQLALENEAGYVPRQRREARVEEGARGSMGWWSWIDAQTNVVRVGSYRAAEVGRAQAKRPETWVTRLQHRLTIKPLVNSLNRIAATLGSRTYVLGLTVLRAATAEYLGFEPGRLDFARWLWALDFHGSRALTYRVAYERLLDPSGTRRPDANDGRDAEHGFAAAFVDILVHEGSHFEIARKAGREAGLACKVFNGRQKANPLEAVIREIENLPPRG